MRISVKIEQKTRVLGPHGTGGTSISSALSAQKIPQTVLYPNCISCIFVVSTVSGGFWQFSVAILKFSLLICWDTGCLTPEHFRHVLSLLQATCFVFDQSLVPVLNWGECVTIQPNPLSSVPCLGEGNTFNF